jgi:hypothetical protein
MGTLVVVDCEAPFGVGAPSVGDMTEFGAVDVTVNALREGREETFHGTDCSEDTFRRFREWLAPRMPVVFVSDNPAYDFQWINFYFLEVPRREAVRALRAAHRRLLRWSGRRFPQHAEVEAPEANDA